jgi:hypothetical protein
MMMDPQEIEDEGRERVLERVAAIAVANASGPIAAGLRRDTLTTLTTKLATTPTTPSSGEPCELWHARSATVYHDLHAPCEPGINSKPWRDGRDPGKSPWKWLRLLRAVGPVGHIEGTCGRIALREDEKGREPNPKVSGPSRAKRLVTPTCGAVCQ